MRLIPEHNPLEWNRLEHTEKILWSHSKENCAFSHRCTLHNRSNHSMRGFPQHWRSDRGIMERTCPHGVGHPDPDELFFIVMVRGKDTAYYEGVHGCDGCCEGAYDETIP